MKTCSFTVCHKRLFFQIYRVWFTLNSSILYTNPTLRNNFKSQLVCELGIPNVYLLRNGSVESSEKWFLFNSDLFCIWNHRYMKNVILFKSAFIFTWFVVELINDLFRQGYDPKQWLILKIYVYAWNAERFLQKIPAVPIWFWYVRRATVYVEEQLQYAKNQKIKI